VRPQQGHVGVFGCLHGIAMSARAHAGRAGNAENATTQAHHVKAVAVGATIEAMF
tara:strand:- start:1104 stop:1268 length:165 start_codon:yes stop_codon:yes gene_type:complete